MKLTEHEFDTIVGFIQQNYGINLQKKKDLVESRLYGLLTNGGYENFTEYFGRVNADPSGEEMANLLNLITTNHTYFLREAKHFEYLEQVVLPWLHKTVLSRDLRIWSAGCSTGEEPYTLAMVMDGFFRSKFENWDTRILGTDISTRALIHAQNGVYGAQSISQMPIPMAKRYFEKVGADQVRITGHIKDQVIFRRFNLMAEHLPFKRKFHVIFCRNVMIYFDQETKNKLVNRFYEMTEPGGYLFIGHSEALKREETMYQYIMPAVYRKTDGVIN